LVRRYARIQSFLVSFVVVFSEAGRLDTLFDEFSLWRTSRAIVLPQLELERAFFR
jgi:hypothetical protein